MRPPQHSIDAVPVLVLPGDPAWDHDRIIQERKAVDEAERDLHPFNQYQQGLTRYDLHARVTWPGGEGCAADYLDGGEVRFTLRRMSVEHYAEVQAAFSREVKEQGENSSFIPVWVKAAKYGIVSISGDPDNEFTVGQKMTDAVLRSIVDKHGDLPALAKIGAAVWSLSQPLTEAEGKR